MVTVSEKIDNFVTPPEILSCATYFEMENITRSRNNARFLFLQVDASKFFISICLPPNHVALNCEQINIFDQSWLPVRNATVLDKLGKESHLPIDNIYHKPT